MRRIAHYDFHAFRREGKRQFDTLPTRRTYGDDLRLLTGLGEDSELGGGALFATTGLIKIGVGVGLGHLTQGDIFIRPDETHQ